MVNILAAADLINQPKVYGAFLLWILSELFERLPEIGDADKPRLIFFFDEAHLLFTDAPAALVEKIEQVVRLIRSKGVGVYFVTHSPADLPDKVKAQLGHRIQHALRAFTPKDQKVVRAAAETLRPNPAFDMERAISELAVGEALVSLLDAKGTPAVTERAWIAPPSSQIGRSPTPSGSGCAASHREPTATTISPSIASRRTRSSRAGRRNGPTAPTCRRRPPRPGHPAHLRHRAPCPTSFSVRPARAADDVKASSRPPRRARRDRSAPVSAAPSCAGRWVDCSAGAGELGT